jgi:hypothetical protein
MHFIYVQFLTHVLSREANLPYFPPYGKLKPGFTRRKPRRRQLPVVPPVPPPETAPDIMMKSGEAS